MAVNERKAICEQEQRDIWMMSSGAKRNLAKASFDSLPAWCLQEVNRVARQSKTDFTKPNFTN